MSTNYYLKEAAPQTCKTCGHTPEVKELHIGKSSVGWCFSLHVIPEEGINSLADWQKRWAAEGVRIEDEYGDALSADEMLKCITNRKRPVRENFSKKFLEQNSAIQGPNYLVRSKLDSRCVGHGAGTYDYIVGDFS